MNQSIPSNLPVTPATFGTLVSTHKEEVVHLLELMQLQQMVKVLQSLITRSVHMERKNLSNHLEDTGSSQENQNHAKESAEVNKLLSRLTQNFGTDPAKAKELLSQLINKMSGLNQKQALNEVLSMLHLSKIEEFSQKYLANLTQMLKNQINLLQKNLGSNPFILAALVSLTKKLSVKPPYTADQIDALNDALNDLPSFLESLMKEGQLSSADEKKFFDNIKQFFENTQSSCKELHQSIDLDAFIKPAIDNLKTKQQISEIKGTITETTATKETSEVSKKQDPSNTTTQVSATRHGTEDSSVVSETNHSSVSKNDPMPQKSLPDSFRHLVLEDYMKEQQKYLMSLALSLQSSNIGMNDLGAIMDIISDFSNAGTSFDVSSLIAAKNAYPYGASISSAYSDEREQIINMLKPGGEITQAIKAIKEKMQEIQDKLHAHPPQIDKSTAASLEKTLMSTFEELQKWIPRKGNEAEDILDFLENTKMTADGHWEAVDLKTKKWYIYTSACPDFVKYLKDAESTIRKGNGSAEPKLESLSKIYSGLSTAQSSYKNLSEQQQTTLQMKMTEIQQEWAVVATALQMLNQMYMTCANAVSK